MITNIDPTRQIFVRDKMDQIALSVYHNEFNESLDVDALFCI